MAVPRARRQLPVTKWLVRQVRRRSSRVRRRIIWFFIGYAPAYNPQVLCYVVVDTPHLPGERAGTFDFASEIFSKIMAEVLPYKNVFPAGGAALGSETNLSSQEEGIISGTATEDPNAAETPAETTPARRAAGRTTMSVNLSIPETSTAIRIRWEMCRMNRRRLETVKRLERAETRNSG